MLSERWAKTSSAYLRRSTITVLCPDLDECLPCVSNGEAVKLNSMSLSEWCMDNSPGVGGRRNTRSDCIDRWQLQTWKTLSPPEKDCGFFYLFYSFN